MRENENIIHKIIIYLVHHVPTLYILADIYKSTNVYINKKLWANVALSSQFVTPYSFLCLLEFLCFLGKFWLNYNIVEEMDIRYQ